MQFNENIPNKRSSKILIIKNGQIQMETNTDILQIKQFANYCFDINEHTEKLKIFIQKNIIGEDTEKLWPNQIETIIENPDIFEKNYKQTIFQILQNGFKKNLRHKFWSYQVNYTKYEQQYKDLDLEKLSKNCSQEEQEQIEKDIKRTPCPYQISSIYFLKFYQSIRLILRAFSGLDYSFSYVQGMNNVISHIFYNICKDNETNIEQKQKQALVYFLILLEEFQVKNIFENDMFFVSNLLNQLIQQIQYNDPILFDKLIEKEAENSYDNFICFGGLFFTLGLQFISYDISGRYLDMIYTCILKSWNLICNCFFLLISFTLQRKNIN